MLFETVRCCCWRNGGRFGGGRGGCRDRRQCEGWGRRRDRATTTATTTATAAAEGSGALSGAAEGLRTALRRSIAAVVAQGRAIRKRGGSRRIDCQVIMKSIGPVTMPVIRIQIFASQRRTSDK